MKWNSWTSRICSTYCGNVIGRQGGGEFGGERAPVAAHQFRGGAQAAGPARRRRRAAAAGARNADNRPDNRTDWEDVYHRLRRWVASQPPNQALSQWVGHDPTGQGRGGGHDPEGAGRCIKKRKIEETQQSIVMDCEGSNLLLLSLGWGRCVATIDGGMFLCSLFVFSSTADNSACARSTPKCCTCAASAAASSGNLSVRVAQFLFFFQLPPPQTVSRRRRRTHRLSNEELLK